MDFWTFSYWAVAALLFGSVLGMVYIDNVAKEKGMDPPFSIVDDGLGDMDGTIIFAAIFSALWVPIICVAAASAAGWCVIWFIKKVILANTIDKLILRLLKDRNKE